MRRPEQVGRRRFARSQVMVQQSLSLINALTAGTETQRARRERAARHCPRSRAIPTSAINPLRSAGNRDRESARWRGYGPAARCFRNLAGAEWRAGGGQGMMMLNGEARVAAASDGRGIRSGRIRGPERLRLEALAAAG